MTFFYDLNRQLAAVEQQHTTPLSEGKNHLGDAEQMTYSGWKAACRKAHPGVWFDGDQDIASAMMGPKPYKRGETKEVGQWDGDKGSVYKSAAKSSAVAESLNMMSEEHGYDSVSPEHAAEIVAYMDRDMPMAAIIDKYPELSRMIDNIAGDYQLHADDDFEEIEDILYGNLAQVADRMLEVADQSDQQSDTLMSEREIANDRDRKFAALAEPYDEITYADKIAGARQGVSEGENLARKLVPGLGKLQARSKSLRQRDQARVAGKEVRADGREEGPTNPDDDFWDENSAMNRHYRNAERFDKIAKGKGPFTEGRIDDLRDRQEADRRERGEEKAASKTKFVAGRAYGGARQEVDDEDDEDAPRTKAKPATDAPRKRGRPVGSKRAIGARGPGVKSKLLKKGALAEYSEVDEGAIDDLRDRLEAERRERGEEKATSKTKFVAGRAYGGARQEVDDEDDEDAPRTKAKPAAGDAPRKRGRPVGSKRAIGARGPGVKSKLLKKGALAETDIDPRDQGEYDQEGDMAHDQLSTAQDAADELRSILTADENLPEWVQKKITMAVDYLDTARDYMKAQKDEVEPVAEKAVSKAQRTAAGIAYAAKKGNVPKSELRGASREMAKMPAGELKKFAKTKEKGLPAKKTKEVEETTTAGSVATGGDAPKSKGKGGMQFGKGIYDSLDRQLEQMIAEGMNVTATVSSQGDTPTKSISVTADGDDADRLMELLSLSGMHNQSAAADHSCPTCGQSPCGCAELVDENSPDWPTNTEVSNDALQYSGGLNRPKSTGQTTGPIPDISSDRQGSGYKGIDEGADQVRFRPTSGVKFNPQLFYIFRQAGGKFMHSGVSTPFRSREEATAALVKLTGHDSNDRDYVVASGQEVLDDQSAASARAAVSWAQQGKDLAEGDSMISRLYTELSKL